MNQQIEIKKIPESNLIRVKSPEADSPEVDVFRERNGCSFSEVQFPDVTSGNGADQDNGDGIRMMLEGGKLFIFSPSFQKN